MAFAQRIITSNSAGDQEFTFTFDYIKEEHIKVFVNFVEKAQGTGSNEFQVITNTTPKKISLNTGLSADNTRVEIRRVSSLSTPLVDFTDGSTLTAADLDTAEKQSLFIDQELDDALKQGISIDTSTGVPTLNSQRLSNVSDPVNAQDAVTKAYLERSGSITSTQIADGTIINADVNASAAIAGTKISPDFGSQNIATSGTVDGRDVSADGTKLDTIETNAKDDQTAAEIRTLVESASDSNVFTDADHTKLNNIEANATADQSNAEIRAAVEAASDSNVFTDADHTKLGNAVTLTDTQTLTNKTLTTPVINDLSGTAVITSGTSTSDNKIYSAKRAGEIFYGKDTVGEIQSGETWSSADDKVATTAAIDARIIDLVDDVGGFVPIANETSFPTANPDAENGTGTIVSVKAASTNLTPSGTTVTISNGAGTGNTVTITGVPSVIASGFGFLVETTTTLHTYTFHRLTPKATEVTAVAGKAVEIGRLGTADAVADMAILGTTDVVADMNMLATSDVIADMNLLATSDVIADMALLAVTDVISDMNDLATSGNITAMSTCSTNISSINNASSNISSVNNFGDKYQVASSDPSTDGGGNALAEGDLYFNTTANELKVYNGGAWQGGVTASGNFASTTGNTFTGSNNHNDNVKSIYGAGSDLQIYHSGNHSFIQEEGTGSLYIDSNQLYLRQASDDTILLQTISNGEVRINHNGNERIRTESDGVAITGALSLGDGSGAGGTNKISFGASDDLNIFHDGSNSFIKDTGTGGLKIMASDLYLRNPSDQDMIYATSGGAVNLFYDNSLKLSTSSNGINVTGLTTSSGGVRVNTDGSASADYISVGASQDLKIYHDGSGSFIADTGTGSLAISGSTVNINNSDNSEFQIKCVENAQVQLYHNGSKKFETASDGISILGAEGGNAFISFEADEGDDNSDKFDIGVYNGGPFKIQNKKSGSWEDNLVITGDAGVELYYDNVKKFETASWGTQSHGHLAFRDNDKAKFGAGDDLQIYHDPQYGHSFIKESGGGALIIGCSGFEVYNPAISEKMLKSAADGAVELYYDNAKRLETTADGVTISGNKLAIGTCQIFTNGNILMADGDELRFGSGEDLKIYHDGNNNYIKGINNDFIYIATNNVNRWSFSNDGHFRPDANNTYDIGSTAQRVRNIYTNDLNLSNEGSSNDVDGTWGSYTIQEGAEDLYLINKRNGKKYKFNLTEVS
jgi:hypothetical protein